MSLLKEDQFTVSTPQGDVYISTSFPLPASKKNEIKNSIFKAIEKPKPIEELLTKIKKINPLAGTPQGAIIAYMTSQSLSQTRLAQKTGIPQSHISAMIHGKRPIGLAMSKKFGRAFGVDYKKFL